MNFFPVTIGQDALGSFQSVKCVAGSREGRLLAVASSTFCHHVSCWSVPTAPGRRFHLVWHTTEALQYVVKAMAFAGSCEHPELLLLTAGGDKSFSLWGVDLKRQGTLQSIMSGLPGPCLLAATGWTMVLYTSQELIVCRRSAEALSWRTTLRSTQFSHHPGGNFFLEASQKYLLAGGVVGKFVLDLDRVEAGWFVIDGTRVYSGFVELAGGALWSLHCDPVDIGTLRLLPAYSRGIQGKCFGSLPWPVMPVSKLCVGMAGRGIIGIIEHSRIQGRCTVLMTCAQRRRWRLSRWRLGWLWVC